MAQKAIIDTATRVIKRITTDAAPVITATETAVAMASPITIASGSWWKLDVSNNKVAATAAEAQTAGIDENFNAAQIAANHTTYINALNTAIASTTTANITAVFQAMKNL